MTDIPVGGPVDEPPPPEQFDPVAILQALERHDVRYVLIGGLAATLHGSPVATYDVDLAPEQSRGNIERLAGALTEIGAVRYTDPDEPFTPPTVDDFTHLVESFSSPIGYIDVFREARAVGGFDRLQPRADRKDVDGIQIVIANLDDIIASKQATDRAKDRAQLPVLLALQEERGLRDQGIDPPAR